MSKEKEYRHLQIEVDSIIKTLIKSEVETKQASVGYYCDTSIGAQDKNLDVLARLLTFDETCTAIMHDGRQLLVSSNRDSPKYAQKYLPFLRDYINSPFRESYERLETEAKVQIIQKIESLTSKKREFLSKIKNATDSKDSSCYSLLQAVKQREVGDVITLSKGIIESRNSATPPHYQTLELAIELIRPIIDLRIITDAIISGNIGSHVIGAIQHNNIQYLPNPYQKHAEIRICDEVIQHIDQMGEGNHYIGIAKLTCCPCGVFIPLYNKCNSKKVYLIFGGTHGGTYDPWMAPEIMLMNARIRNDFFKDLNSLIPAAYIKDKEVAPYTEEELDLYLDNSAGPILVQFDSLEEAMQVITKHQVAIKELDTKKTALKQHSTNIQRKEEKITIELKQKKTELSHSHSKYQRLQNEIKVTQESLRDAQKSFDKSTLNTENLNKIIENSALTEENKYARIKDLVINQDRALFNKERDNVLKAKGFTDKIKILVDAYNGKLGIVQKLKKLEALKSQLRCLEQEVRVCNGEMSTINSDIEYLIAQLNEQDKETTIIAKEIQNLQQKLNNIKSEYDKLKHCIKTHTEKQIPEDVLAQQQVPELLSIPLISMMHEARAAETLGKQAQAFRVSGNQDDNCLFTLPTASGNSLFPQHKAMTIIAQPEQLDTTWYDFLSIRNSLVRITPTINPQRILNEVTNDTELLTRLHYKFEANSHYIIPLNVNAVDGSFEAINHWVGLYITIGEDAVPTTIRYINPIGQCINKELSTSIYQATRITPQDITEGRGIQFAFDLESGPPELTGNINDCGPMLVLLLSELVNYDEIRTHSLNQRESMDLGQRLRQQQYDGVDSHIVLGSLPIGIYQDESDASSALITNVPIECVKLGDEASVSPFPASSTGKSFALANQKEDHLDLIDQRIEERIEQGYLRDETSRNSQTLQGIESREEVWEIYSDEGSINDESEVLGGDTQ